MQLTVPDVQAGSECAWGAAVAGVCLENTCLVSVVGALPCRGASRASLWLCLEWGGVGKVRSRRQRCGRTRDWAWALLRR